MTKCNCELYRQVAVELELGIGELEIDFEFKQICVKDYYNCKNIAYISIKFCPFCGRDLCVEQLKIEGC